MLQGTGTAPSRLRTPSIALVILEAALPDPECRTTVAATTRTSCPCRGYLKRSPTTRRALKLEPGHTLHDHVVPQYIVSGRE